MKKYKLIDYWGLVGSLLLLSLPLIAFIMHIINYK